jgi:ribosomal protein L29
MNATKPFHDEVSAKGGKSRSPAKLEAVRRNLAKAKAVQAEKRALKAKK